MAIPAFDRKALKERLIALDSKRQLAFGAACCERLLPNYLAFKKDTGWGDFSPIREALDSIWTFLYGQSLSSQQVKNLTIACESSAPNSDDFVSLYVTSAQDACFAVCSLLDYIIENDAGKIAQAATYAIDSVDLYVQEIESMTPNDPMLEQKILMHRFMQRELMRQDEDLKNIKKAPSLDREFLVGLKEYWNNDGKSNLDIP